MLLVVGLWVIRNIYMKHLPGHVHAKETQYLNNMSFRVINLPQFTTEAHIHSHP